MDEAALWKKNIPELFKELKSKQSGLSEKEVQARLKENGSNSIPDKDRREWSDILVAQLNNPLLIILIIASVVSAYLGELFDALIIIAIIIISAILGFYQEYKSERVLSELKKYISYKAIVLRDGEKKQIDARELVIGDVVYVGLGDIIPADMRILETQGISVNESALSGESREVRKDANPLQEDKTSLQEITNGLFMGATVNEGFAKAVIVATGEQTFFGKTAIIFSAKVPESDFQVEMRKFGGLLLRVITILALVIFVSNFLLGHGDGNPLADSLLFALAVAVGIAPEALPIVVSITLSNGSMHLAKKKVVTKKLAAIEDLGNMDILCTDKTGTLTEEEIRMERAIGLDGLECKEVMEYSFICNAAVGSSHVKGNAIDVAIRKHGISLKVDTTAYERIASIPFDFTRRRMGQVIEKDNQRTLIVKGAPESVLQICNKVFVGNKPESLSQTRRQVIQSIESYNAAGYTTIAVASKDIGNKKEYSTADENNMSFLGFILLSNAPKHDVNHTLLRLQKLGISLKILTGDDARVTKKLCEDIGFCDSEDRIVLGSEIAHMDAEELKKAAEKYSVFARMSPEQKLHIVEALRANGHVVGFLGDGINDAPSLRTADIGISVDSAADVAKGASHIILLQKSLGVVCDGVEEGRRIFGNVTKYILNTMSANQGNMITVSLSSFFLPFIPLLPTQILLNNMLSDVPLMSISSDNVDSVYVRKPQKWNMDFILKFMVFFGLISTFYDLLFIGIMHFIMKVPVDAFRTGWFLESVLSEMIIVFSLRTQLPFFKSMPSRLLAIVSILCILIAFGLVYFAPAAAIFRFVPLGSELLVLIGLILFSYFVTTEIGKMFFFHKVANGNNHANKVINPNHTIHHMPKME